jgi:hypothetical protein
MPPNSAVNVVREAWFEGQHEFDPTRIVFIDDTATNTKMGAPFTVARRGASDAALRTHGHWEQLSSPAGLCHDDIAVPIVMDGPMTGEAIIAHVEQALVPEL